MRTIHKSLISGKWLMWHAILAVTFAAACAPASFDGDAGMQHLAQKTDDPPKEDDTPTEPNDASPPMPPLPPEDTKVLSDCSKKAGLNFLTPGKYTVETADIAVGIGNRTQWQDTLASSDIPRVLIVNIRGQIANRLAIELGNPKTTYCLNVNLQVVNRFDLTVSKTARLIDVYNTQIVNRSSKHQI